MIHKCQTVTTTYCINNQHFCLQIKATLTITKHIQNNGHSQPETNKNQVLCHQRILRYPPRKENCQIFRSSMHQSTQNQHNPTGSTSRLQNFVIRILLLLNRYCKLEMAGTIFHYCKYFQLTRQYYKNV